MLFAKYSSNGQIATPIVCVNDIIITGDFEEEIKRLKKASAEN